MRPISLIVIHCTDSPDALDVGAAEVRRWHTDPPPMGRGWSDIGYHWVIRRDGTVEPGRPEEVVGSHVAGHNTGSLGIVWVGKFLPSAAQSEALIGKLLELMRQYGVSVDKVVGHKELNPGKTCPNLNMDSLRATLRQRLKLSAP